MSVHPLYLLLALNFFPNSQAQASRVVSLTLFLPSRMDRTWKETEHEREREREHGKEGRSPISHCIGMRKKGKSWGNFGLMNSNPQNCCPCHLFSISRPHSRQATRKGKRLSPDSASCIPAIRWRDCQHVCCIFWTRSYATSHIGRPVIASVVTILTNAFCFARLSPPLPLPRTARTRPICLLLLIVGPTGPGSACNLALLKCQLRHITPTADLWPLCLIPRPTRHSALYPDDSTRSPPAQAPSSCFARIVSSLVSALNLD